jgi:hypothetical protein
VKLETTENGQFSQLILTKLLGNGEAEVTAVNGETPEKFKRVLKHFRRIEFQTWRNPKLFGIVGKITERIFHWHRLIRLLRYGNFEQ